jgi:hypothetical protein
MNNTMNGAMQMQKGIRQKKAPLNRTAKYRRRNRRSK